MACDIYEMDSYLTDFNSKHDALRSVFFKLPSIIHPILEGKPTQMTGGGASALKSAVIEADEDRDTFTLKYMSRSYEFQFTCIVEAAAHGYAAKGRIKVMRKFAYQHSDEEQGTEVAEFNFDTQGHVTGLDYFSRQLGSADYLERFLIELLFNDLVSDARRSSSLKNVGV